MSQDRLMLILKVLYMIKNQSYNNSLYPKNNTILNVPVFKRFFLTIKIKSLKNSFLITFNGDKQFDQFANAEKANRLKNHLSKYAVLSWI